MIEYDLALPPLHRILSVSYLNETLDLDSTAVMGNPYLVSISDFYVGKGGDGVDAFTSQEIIADHKELISDCVVRFLRTCVDTLSGKPPGRFSIAGTRC